MLGEVGLGEESARLKRVYGKGKRRRDCTVILNKSEHPVPMGTGSKRICENHRPVIYQYMEEHPEIVNQKEGLKPKKKKGSSTGK
jgi:hypothetical protein